MQKPDDDEEADLSSPATLPTMARFTPSANTPAPPTRTGPEVLAGRYHLLGMIAVGGMGTVYRARDAELEEVVALKVLRPELVQMPGMLERFRLEAKLARRVTHHNVARIYDIGEHGGEKFLTMELVEGVSLAARVHKSGPLPVAELVEVAGALCAGLSAAHAAGVIHRDLKPDNVLVDKSGRVVITDFGIARAFDAGTESLRTSGTVVGTPAYMAPEQVEGAKEIDARADIYALGAVLYELATGAVPWEGGSYFVVAAARLSNPPPDPRHRRPDLPDALANLIQRCMARRPEDRYPSAADVAADLARITRPPAPPAEHGHGAHGDHGVASAPTAPDLPATATPAGDGHKTVAVLPVRNAGPPEDEYLADGLTDDLIDNLSMTAGLRVRPRGGVMQWKRVDKDPREVGRALDVQLVVDGSLRRAGSVLRISVRLISVADGFQLWARRFDRPAADVLAVGEEAACAIAEALTVQRGAPARSAPQDPVAVDLYLRARFEYFRFNVENVRRAAELLDEALARTPDDPTILSFYSIVHVRLWFLGAEDAERARDTARRAAEHAVVAGPHLGEPHVALATVQLHAGEPAAAARSLRHALALAPRLVEAHDNLGRILVEVDRIDEGISHLQTAIGIQPSLTFPRWEIARAHALLGRWQQVDQVLQWPLDHAPEMERQVRWFSSMRMVMWRRDMARLAEMVEEPASASWPFVHIMRDLARGKPPSAEEFGRFGPIENTPDTGRRRRAFLAQIRAEVALLCGDVDYGLGAITDAVDSGVFDIAWLDRCPLLEAVRHEPRFLAERARVEARVRPVLEALAPSPR